MVLEGDQMPNTLRSLLLIAYGTVIAPSLLIGQCTAVVDGKIVDELGRPLALASVHLVEMMPSLENRYFGPFETDTVGHFHVTEPVSESGKYFISAMKEDAGYPNTRLAFYNDQEPQFFTLDCNVSRSGIVLKVGPKAAFIQHIDVSDASTGKPIEGASITLRRLSSPMRTLPPSAFVITTSTALLTPKGKYSGLAVPSNVDISYQISAPGYLASPDMKLHLKPSEDINIQSKLKRF